MKTETNNRRIDQALVTLGFAKTRSMAHKMIDAGQVYIQYHDLQPQLVRKSSLTPREGSKILVGEGLGDRYVSRGGIKLQGALDYFDVPVQGLRALDVGISTGGFTDCLLQRGVAEVVGIDVGHDQTSVSVKNDPRVKIFEGVNAKDLSSFQFLEPFDLIVMDVSFISLTKICEEVFKFLNTNGKILALVKPQFELQAAALNKKGVVKSDADIDFVRTKILTFFEHRGLQVMGFFNSPINGGSGNREFFIYAKI